MTKELLTVAFDYSVLDKEVKGKLLNLAGQIKRHGKAFMDAGMELGQAIHEAHSLLAGDGRDGKFSQWIELEAGMSRSTAYEWKNTYERAKKCPVIGSFPPTVACLLAAPSVPDDAIKDFAKQIDKGAKPTVKLAKQTLERFKDVSDKPRQKPRSPKTQKLPSQSDQPPTPAEDEPDEQTEVKPLISGGGTFKPEECEAAANVGKLFSELLEHLRLSTVLLDKINRAAPNDRQRQEVFDSLECANLAIHEWRKKARAA